MSSAAPTKQADASAHNIRFDIIIPGRRRERTITHAYLLSARYPAAADPPGLTSPDPLTADIPRFGLRDYVSYHRPRSRWGRNTPGDRFSRLCSATASH